MLRTRLFTAVALVLVFLSGLFLLPELYWDALMLGVVCLGAWEWAQLSRFQPPWRGLFVLALLTSGMLLLPMTALAPYTLWQQEAELLIIAAATLFWLLLAPWWMHRRVVPGKTVLAVLGWVILLSTWLAIDSLRRVSPLLVLGVVGTVWIADTAAYLAGRRFGRRKLAPQISPGKTWEGAIGALLAVTLYGAALCWVTGLGFWLLIGLWGLTVLSIMGDLFESMLKRQAGLKDSGTLLPGHGGVLDRIDALTSTLPVAAFYVYFPLYFSLFDPGSLA